MQRLYIIELSDFIWAAPHTISMMVETQGRNSLLQLKYYSVFHIEKSKDWNVINWYDVTKGWIYIELNPLIDIIVLSNDINA